MTGDFNLSEYSRDYQLLQARLGDAYRTAGWGFGHTFPRVGTFPKSLPAPWPVVRLDYVWHSPELRPVAAQSAPAGAATTMPWSSVWSRPMGADPSSVRRGRGEASPKMSGGFDWYAPNAGRDYQDDE